MGVKPLDSNHSVRTVMITGVAVRQLSGVERSERNVSIDNIARIARGLKVKACVLLDDSVKL
jgi:transcriptional regulator with XRE-family HTH domain